MIYHDFTILLNCYPIAKFWYVAISENQKIQSSKKIQEFLSFATHAKYKNQFGTILTKWSLHPSELKPVQQERKSSLVGTL